MELGILFKKNYSDFARKALETFASGNDKNWLKWKKLTAGF